MGELGANQIMFSTSTRLTLDQLRAVSSDKKEPKAKTILHLCGNGFCTEEEHLGIGTKALNDQLYSCHRLLQSAESFDEYLRAQSLCWHKVPCWTVHYSGIYAINHEWAQD